MELKLGRPIADGMMVLHASHSVCGNRNCVNPTHLREGTNVENCADKVADGTLTRGTHNASCKLTEDQVLAIRADTRSDKLIANDYNVARQTVNGIKLRKLWDWL